MIFLEYILFYLNNIFSFILHSNWSFPSLFFSCPPPHRFPFPAPFHSSSISIQEGTGLLLAWTKHGASSWVRIKLRFLYQSGRGYLAWVTGAQQQTKHQGLILLLGALETKLYNCQTHAEGLGLWHYEGHLSFTKTLPFLSEYMLPLGSSRVMRFHSWVFMIQKMLWSPADLCNMCCFY